MGYKDLHIWRLADRLVSEIHSMTLEDLPAFEQYETGNQIRRSIKSVKSNIVEGYGRKSVPKEYYRFLVFAIASLDETRDHLETLHNTGSLADSVKFNDLKQKIDALGKMLYRFSLCIKSDIQKK